MYTIQKSLEYLLELTRTPVGVKIFYDEENWEKCSFPVPKSKMPYCVMVRQAGKGMCWKGKKDNLGCMGGARALGLVRLDDEYSTGKMFTELGLYKNIQVSENVVSAMSIIKDDAVGFAVAPLEAFEDEPDVVLIICKPYTAMRAVQGYTYTFGTNTEFRMSGNQAICSECTAYPILYKKINVSMLCSGTRIKAGWQEEELAIGVPFEAVMELINGIKATADLQDDDKHKKRLIENIEVSEGVIGLDMQDIHYQHNYFTGLYKVDKKRFEEE